MTIDSVCTGQDVLKDDAWLTQNQITHVLSLGKTTLAADKAAALSIHMVHIDVKDREDSQLLEHLPEGVLFIHTARQNGGCCYVHCSAGISRSTTLVCAYLMCSLCPAPSLDHALAMIQACRPAAEPNEAFMLQVALKMILPW